MYVETIPGVIACCCIHITSIGMSGLLHILVLKNQFPINRCTEYYSLLLELLNVQLLCILYRDHAMVPVATMSSKLSSISILFLHYYSMFL